MHDDGAPTPTSQQQHALEQRVAKLYADLTPPLQPTDATLALLSDRHARYLRHGLGQLPAGFSALDASRPWIVYWVLHGLALLGAPLPDDISAADVVTFLEACQDSTGGFGGGPRQLPHLAPTYAAVCSLLTLGGEAALMAVRRDELRQFLLRMAIDPAQGGGFIMHGGGECDVRACYTAMAVAHGLCLDLQELVTVSGMVDYVRRCQTYEGGLGGEPGNEAHGGYTFCGVAALLLAGRPDVLDVPRLLHWAAQRQCWVEGGFNGRTNKLADGCYSFWQGGLFPLLQRLGPEHTRQSKVARSVAGDMVAAPAASSDDEPWDLVVPELPPLDGVLGPVELAEQENERKQELAEALVQAAVDLHQRGSRGRQQEAAQEAHASTKEVLERASAAQQAAELAEAHLEIARHSAAVLLAGWDGVAAGTSGGTDNGGASQPDAGSSGSSHDRVAAAAADTRQDPLAEIERDPASGCSSGRDTAATASGTSRDPKGAHEDVAACDPSSMSRDPNGKPEGMAVCHPTGLSKAASEAETSNPLCHPAALQLWVLRACQQARGGLRDKPGKQADFYHSCYCLSGLAAAQHLPGSCVLGPEGNELGRADPLMNVLEERVQQARAFYTGRPLS